jgi:hypothetical protein
MLNRFGLALASLAAVAAATAALGAAGTAAPASAGSLPPRTPGATPPCGSTCASYYVREFGPHYVLNDYYGRLSPGTPVNLRPASNASLKEDWAIWPSGTVAQLARLGLVSRKLDLHYASDQAFELEYAPLGAGSGRCAGLARTAASSEPVTLQWCGQDAGTIWVVDAADASDGFTPLINGSDTNFSDPQVLTEPGSPPTGVRPWLVSYRLQTFADGTVHDDQMWADTLGVLP